MIAFVILLFSSEKSCAIRMRSHRAPRPSFFFLAPKGMYFERFARRSVDGRSASCEHVSTTCGAEAVRGYWRVRTGKTSVADQVAYGSHSTNCTTQMCPCSSPNRISDLFKEHSHLHESNDGSSVFSDYSHTRCESATRDPVTGVLRMSEQDAQSHTRCAHPHTNFLADKTLTALVQWCGAPRMQPLAR